MRRSTEDLIAELEAAADQHDLVAMLVAFEDSTIQIYANDEGRLQKLNEAVQMDGNPIGLLAVDQSAGEVTIRTHIFPDNVEAGHEDVCLNYMERMGDEFRKGNYILDTQTFQT